MLACMCVVILTVSCATMAYETGTSPSVGTVLFSKEDIQKPHWTRTQISLLQARKYFQSILPPQDLRNNYNDDYIIKLLAYIKDGYSNIKREAVDLETDSIMTAAFSDTLGGYFKAWVLPVAKLNYYGGTVSQDNVIKLFQFYGELKSYLDTDGQGWCAPDNRFLKSIPINVAPPMQTVEHISHPCDQLAYFEKTSSGLGIPLPKVNWNDKSSTLFVPLKNMTLIPMIARDTSKTLVRYYNVAKSCLVETSPKEVKKFVKRFQVWLSRNVITHLKDEPLYLALGNVLTLTNMTVPRYNNLLFKDRAAQRSYFSEPIPIEMPSRKVTIILIILFLELAWCIPALIYLLCSKKKKDCTSNVYLFIDQNKPCKQGKQMLDKINSSCCRKNKPIKREVHITGSKKEEEEGSKTLDKQYPSNAICASTLTSTLQLGKRSDAYYMEFQGQYPSSNLTKITGTGSRSYYSSKNQACETAQIAPIPRDSKKSMLKKSTSPRPLKNNPSVVISKQNEVSSLFKNVSYIKESKTPSALNRNHDKGSKSVSRKRTDRSKEIKAIMQIKPGGKHYEKSFDDLTRVKTVKIHPETLRTPPGYQPAPKIVPACTLASNLVPSCEPDSKMIPVCQSHSKTVPGSQSNSKIVPASQTDSKVVNVEKEQSSLFYFADTAICPCSGCIHNINDIHEEILSGSLVAKDKPSDENVEISTLQTIMPHYTETQVIEIKSARPTKEHVKPSRSKKAVFEVRDTTKQYYQMTIENPTTEINLNIGTKQTTTQSKRSKIPKLANPSKILISKMSGRIQRALSPNKESKKKSLIPQLTKKALDDMSLSKDCSESTDHSRFNDTI